MSLCGTVLFNVSFSPLFWHFQPQLISEGFSCLPGVLRGRTERRAAFFFFFFFFSGPWPLDTLGICSAIIWARGLILSLHAMLCLSEKKKNRRPLFARLGKTITPPALPDRAQLREQQRNENHLRFLLRGQASSSGYCQKTQDKGRPEKRKVLNSRFFLFGP